MTKQIIRLTKQATYAAGITISIFCAILMTALPARVFHALGAEIPLYNAELIFPPEHWHNHASCVVETPRGDLLVCWFHGSGEREADDVRIEGARKRKGAKGWSSRFVMADTPGYPDTNCTMFIDPQKRLWLLWPTIMANRWETALMKYKISTDYESDGAPKWAVSNVLHVTPGREFTDAVSRYAADVEVTAASAEAVAQTRLRSYVARLRQQASDKLSQRLGWMTRAHPFILDGVRLIVPLYSDGYSFSLMAISDDWGGSWHTSTPLVGPGNIQPSIARRNDGSLFALMRDNGPAPKRLHQSESRDRGETWTPVRDSDLPNPGSGAEIARLANGHFVLVSNDTEYGRNSLAVQISDDEARTWKWKRHLEYVASGPEAGSYHYPSVMQARDGSLHVTYSYHLTRKGLPLDSDGLPARKSIKHAQFNEAWVMEGDR